MGKTVQIKCKQVVEYDQTVTLTDADYELVKDLDMDDVSEMDSDTKKMYRVIDKYINKSDVIDVEPEYTDVQVTIDGEEQEEEDEDNYDEE